jgi:hypothetical protein
MSPTPIDEAQLRALHAQGHSQRAMATMLGIPRRTLRKHLTFPICDSSEYSCTFPVNTP